MSNAQRLTKQMLSFIQPEFQKMIRVLEEAKKSEREREEREQKREEAQFATQFETHDGTV